MEKLIGRLRTWYLEKEGQSEFHLILNDKIEYCLHYVNYLILYSSIFY